jgi:hypothetical protein
MAAKLHKAPRYLLDTYLRQKALKYHPLKSINHCKKGDFIANFPEIADFLTLNLGIALD